MLLQNRVVVKRGVCLIIVVFFGNQNRDRLNASKSKWQNGFLCQGSISCPMRRRKADSGDSRETDGLLCSRTIGDDSRQNKHCAQRSGVDVT